MRMKLLTAVMPLMLFAAVAQAQPVTTNSPFTYTITTTVAPGVTSVLPSNSAATLPPANAGTVLATMNCVTNPPGGVCKGPITLSGSDAAKFTLTNGGMVPTSLAVGAANLGSPAGTTYNLTASASQ